MGGIPNKNEESLAEDEKMDNVRQTYDLFIQNQLSHTSHSLEHLPSISHVDDQNSKFNFEYFLLGTHTEEEDFTDKLFLGRIRVPNQSLTQEQMASLSKDQKNLSRLEIVKEFDHDQEVNKARCMPQNIGIVASMTNRGEINLYNFPEIRDRQASEPAERLKCKLTGLEDESFALSWNQHQEGILASCAQKLICLWDFQK